MRWRRRVLPADDVIEYVRVRRRFLWLPTTLPVAPAGRETRWLEWAEVQQVSYGENGRWYDQEFFDR